MSKVYLIIKNEFDDISYYDTVIKVFTELKLANDFIKDSKLDLRVEEIELEDRYDGNSDR